MRMRETTGPLRCNVITGSPHASPILDMAGKAGLTFEVDVLAASAENWVSCDPAPAGIKGTNASFMT
jgi:hypothetical protein